MSFLNSGQVCIAVKRIYVQETIYDRFLTAFIDHVKTFKLGDGFDDGVFVGPLQNKQQYDIARRFLSEIESQNLTVALGGSVVTTGPGFFISPTVVDRPPDTSDLVREEPFGKCSGHTRERCSADLVLTRSKHRLYPYSPGRVKMRLSPEPTRLTQALEALSGLETLSEQQGLRANYKLEQLGLTSTAPSTLVCHSQV